MLAAFNETECEWGEMRFVPAVSLQFVSLRSFGRYFFTRHGSVINYERGSLLVDVARKYIKLPSLAFKRNEVTSSDQID